MRFSGSLIDLSPAILAWLAFSSTVNAFPVDETELVARQSQKCYSGVFVLSARGTFEPQNASLSDVTGYTIARTIPDSYFRQTIYPGNVDPTSPLQGYFNLKKDVEEYNAACPQGKIVLMGYSQGAYVVGDVIANSIASASISSTIAKNIVALVMFGDPGRNKELGNESLQSPVCATSSLAPRSGDSYNQITAYKDRLLEFCHPGDPVCCSTGDDFLHDHLGYFTDERARDIAQYVAGKLK